MCRRFHEALAGSNTRHATLERRCRPFNLKCATLVVGRERRDDLRAERPNRPTARETNKVGALSEMPVRRHVCVLRVLTPRKRAA